MARRQKVSDDLALVELQDLRRGDKILLSATVDHTRGGVYLIFDGAKIGRVIRMYDDVLAVRVGRSSNYVHYERKEKREAHTV